MSPPTILVFGATGITGGFIITSLLDLKEAKVIGVVRETSLNKSSVRDFKTNGMEIRAFDLDDFTPEDAKKLFEGVDVVIAAFQWTHVQTQYALIDAAKKAGVKRFVPCDWATPCVRGVRRMFDMKLDVREYLQTSGVGYTFIDVGWWTQLLLPSHKGDPPYHAKVPGIKEFMEEKIGSYETHTAVTDVEDIGPVVARVVNDERTLGRYVFVWGEEVTQRMIVEVVEELCPIKIEFKHMTEEELVQAIRSLKENEDGELGYARIKLEYQYSFWVREDNLIEKAKKPEYGNALDAKELYSDFKPKTFREVAEKYYRS